MAWPTTEHMLQLASALGVGGIAVRAISWFARRRDAERREPANMTSAAAELSHALSEGSTELLNEFRKEFEYLRKRVSELQAEVDKGKVEAREARELAEAAQDKHAKCETKVAELQARIDLLMAGPVATYSQVLGK